MRQKNKINYDKYKYERRYQFIDRSSKIRKQFLLYTLNMVKEY